VCPTGRIAAFPLHAALADVRAIRVHDHLLSVNSISGPRESSDSLRPARFLAGSAQHFENFGENHGVIVLTILSRIEQCHRPAARAPSEGVEGFVAVGRKQLRSIAPAEFVPPGGVVSEPAAQGSRGGEIASPGNKMGARLANAPRPKTVQQYAIPVFWAGWIIDPTETNGNPHSHWLQFQSI
jgi:hypothetical protein